MSHRITPEIDQVTAASNDNAVPQEPSVSRDDSAVAIWRRDQSGEAARRHTWAPVRLT